MEVALQIMMSMSSYPTTSSEGAKYNGVVRHCFQCSASAEAKGVDGILKGYYHDAFASWLIVSGPTDITQVIQAAGAHAIKTAEEKQAYTILVILTDGSVSDVEVTANWLHQIQQAPLSIVIMDIGDGDFTDMSFLDEKGDGQHNIAQFVPFAEHADNTDSLTGANLNKIPGQLVDQFVSNSIQPNPPVALAVEESPVEPFHEEDEIDLTLTFGDDDEIFLTVTHPRQLKWSLYHRQISSRKAPLF